MPAKLVVKKYRNGSRVSLLGPSGKELLTSAVFTEPRAKGATLRSLKTLLGDDVVVEDHTTAAALKASATKPTSVAAVAAKVTKEVPKVTAQATKAVAKIAAKPGAKPAGRAKRTTKAAAKKTPTAS